MSAPLSPARLDAGASTAAAASASAASRLHQLLARQHAWSEIVASYICLPHHLRSMHQGIMPYNHMLL